MISYRVVFSPHWRLWVSQISFLYEKISSRLYILVLELAVYRAKCKWVGLQTGVICVEMLLVIYTWLAQIANGYKVSRFHGREISKIWFDWMLSSKPFWQNGINILIMHCEQLFAGSILLSVAWFSARSYWQWLR